MNLSGAWKRCAREFSCIGNAAKWLGIHAFVPVLVLCDRSHPTSPCSLRVFSDSKIQPIVPSNSIILCLQVSLSNKYEYQKLLKNSNL